MSVSRVLERVVRMLGVVAREKEVTLTYETDEDAVVRATEDDIHQILYNLMENGIKYSGSMGFVHTTLKTVGDTVVISVEDNGIGIPDEDMEQQESLKRVREIMSGLPEAQRTALQLREIEGHSYRETADIMNVSEANVKVLIFRARQAVKNQIDKIENYGL